MKRMERKRRERQILLASFLGKDDARAHRKEKPVYNNERGMGRVVAALLGGGRMKRQERSLRSSGHGCRPSYGVGRMKRGGPVLSDTWLSSFARRRTNEKMWPLLKKLIVPCCRPSLSVGRMKSRRSARALWCKELSSFACRRTNKKRERFSEVALFFCLKQTMEQSRTPI